MKWAVEYKEERRYLVAKWLVVDLYHLEFGIAKLSLVTSSLIIRFKPSGSVFLTTNEFRVKVYSPFYC
jgi:hypothetical protein